MEPTEKIIEETKYGAVKVSGAKNHSMKTAEKATFKAESAVHQADDEKAGTETHDDAAQAENTTSQKKQKAKAEPKAPKVAAFPVKGSINKYGFIGVNVGICNALGLPPAPKGAKGKLTHNVKIEFSKFDSTTRELTIRIL